MKKKLCNKIHRLFHPFCFCEMIDSEFKTKELYKYHVCYPAQAICLLRSSCQTNSVQNSLPMNH